MIETKTRRYADGTESIETVLSAAENTITVDPNGCAVTSFHVGDHAVFYEGSMKKRSGCPLLFPYFGKSVHGPQHGFGRLSRWHEDRLEADNALQFTLTQEDIAAEAAAYYPYPFTASVTLSFDEHGAFVYQLNVVNTGKGALPVMPGLHPYFSISHAEKQEVTVIGIDDFDAAAWNWDEAPPDTDYGFYNPILIEFPRYSVKMTDLSEKKTVSQCTVWSEPLSAPDHDFICFEPVCGVRGGFDTNAHHVLPGEEYRLEVSTAISLHE